MSVSDHNTSDFVVMLAKRTLRLAEPLLRSVAVLTHAQAEALPPSLTLSESAGKDHQAACNVPAWGPRRSFHAGRSTWLEGGGPGFLAQQFASNQFASGGLALMAVGVLGAAARSVAERGIEYAKRKLFVRMEIDSRDDSYRWIMAWLASHPEFKDSPRVSVTTSLAAFGTSGLEGSLVGSRRVFMLPAPGDHMLRHNGHWVWLSRRRATGMAFSPSNSKLLVETLVVSAWGRNRGVLEDLLASAAAAYEADSRQRTVVHSVDADGYWARVGSRPIRPLNTVVLPGKQAEDLLADCIEFLNSEAWYAHHGIPYRRGYLLYGSPGTGKTSMVTALAGALGLDVYVVTLSSPSMSDETLRSLLNSAADRCILLLEDVDAAFVGRASQLAAGGAGPVTSGLTFSGLLNAIDGVAAQEGRLLFLTTNHIDRLSSALIRPGRVDVRCEFKLAARDQVFRLFKSFYTYAPPAATTLPHAGPPTSTGPSHKAPAATLPHMTGAPSTPITAVPAPGSKALELQPAAAQQQPTEEAGNSQEHQQVPHVDPATLDALAHEFADAVPEYTVSMAALQGYLMQGVHKRDPVAAVRGVRAWVAGVQAAAQAAAQQPSSGQMQQ